MTTTTARPSHGLEHKAAAALLAPRPAPGGRPATPAPGAPVIDDDTGTVVFIGAVTGVVDDVGDILAVGCFTKTLRERTHGCAWPTTGAASAARCYPPWSFRPVIADSPGGPPPASAGRKAPEHWS